MGSRLLLLRMLLAGLVLLVLLAAWPTDQGQAVRGYLWGRLRGGYTLEERLADEGARAQLRLRPALAAAGLAQPVALVNFLVFKDSQRLEVYARDATSQPWRFVKAYDVQGMSGALGPKLREGDQQVPEGSYAVESLNPNSRFHLSLRLNYPTPQDQQIALAQGRSDLGGDIMIHGTAQSVGCVAVGNQAVEELFVLAAQARDPVRVLIAPTDLRVHPVPPSQAAWVDDLYQQLRQQLAPYSH